MPMETGSEQLFSLDEYSLSAPQRRQPAGWGKTFHPYDSTQQFLLPPSIDDWLPADHEARFISEAVDHLLDLDVIYASYEVRDGAPPYDPAMMLKLLLWGYSTGVTSSREMERRCTTDVAFRFLSANQVPDYRSISRYRRRHLEALHDLFLQVLSLCGAAGLIKLGHVALDGTKLRASASRHKAMSYDRLGPRIAEIEAQVTAILDEAEGTHPEECNTAREDGTQTTDEKGPSRLCASKNNSRTRLRPDEGSPGRRAPSPARSRWCERRMDSARALPQPAQTGQPTSAPSADSQRDHRHHS